MIAWRVVPLAIVGAATVACGPVRTMDRVQATTFERLSGGNSFRYVGFADASYPESDPHGEAYRLQLLGEWLNENNMCGAGYSISSRTVTVVNKGLLGTIAKVAYEGHCK